MPSLLSGKTFCVVTGASKGLGRCIAEKFAPSLPASSTLVLLARSLDKLEQVKSSILMKNSSLAVVTRVLDQSKFTDCANGGLFADVLTEVGKCAGDYDEAMIVHNAGSTGDLTKYAAELTDVATVERSMNTNVTGVILLNANFLQMFSKDVAGTRVVINISSLAALQPYSSWSLYCTGKAARDMFFRTLALEDASLRVVNYSPGPLDTDMQKECRESRDTELRETFRSMQREGQLLSCDQSVEKLIGLLAANTFTSGSHVDYYDL